MTEPSPSRHALAKAKVLQHCESDYFVPCETGSAFDGLVIASSMPGFDELIDHTYRLGYIRLVANVKVAYFNIIRLAPAKRGREESAFWEYPKIKEGPQRYHAAFYVLLPDTNVDVVGLIPAELYFMLFEGREEPQDMNDPIPTSLTPYMMQINRLGAALDRVRDAALKISAFMVPGSEMALRGWNVRVREVDLADQVAEDNDDTEDLEADHAEDASGQMQPTNATATDKQHSGLFTTFSPSDTAIQLQDICAHK